MKGKKKFNFMQFFANLKIRTLEREATPTPPITMRKYPDTILDIIAASDLNLNNISKLSGVSNTYLTKLSKGQINHPGKDKIASILLALNHTVSEINAVLAEYDYRALNEHDIPAILVNNQRRKIEGRILPHYDRLHFEMILAVFEAIGGTKVLVKNRPSGIYQPYALYMMKEFQLEVGGEAARFLYALTGRMVQERLRLFRENCRKGSRVVNYMCGKCFSESMDRNIGKCVRSEDTAKLKLYAQYYANAISNAVKFPEQHRFHIVERCSTFEFLIQDADGKKPKINFTGSSPHSYENPYDQHNLQGFSTDAPPTLRLFEGEVEMCKASLNSDDPRNTPQGLREYVAEKFARWDARKFFDEAMDELLATSEVKLF